MIVSSTNSSSSVVKGPFISVDSTGLECRCTTSSSSRYGSPVRGDSLRNQFKGPSERFISLKTFETNSQSSLKPSGVHVELMKLLGRRMPWTTTRCIFQIGFGYPIPLKTTVPDEFLERLIVNLLVFPRLVREAQNIHTHLPFIFSPHCSWSMFYALCMSSRDGRRKDTLGS